MLLGIAGAVLGGFLGRSLGWYGPNDGAGFFMSLLGAVALLGIYRMIVDAPDGVIRGKPFQSPKVTPRALAVDSTSKSHAAQSWSSPRTLFEPRAR
jgi:hypothetical protein